MIVTTSAEGFQVIELTDHEIRFIENIARKWALNAREMKLRDMARSPDTSSEEIQIVGAAGEYVVHRTTRLPWNLLVDPVSFYANRKKRNPDLGEDVQVRTVTKPSNKLLLRRKDPSPHRYVLVDGSSYPKLMIVGWMDGFTVKREGVYTSWWAPQYKPVYLFPRDELHPMENFMEDSS